MERKGNPEGECGRRKCSQKPGAETPTFSAVWQSVTPRGVDLSHPLSFHVPARRPRPISASANPTKPGSSPGGSRESTRHAGQDAPAASAPPGSRVGVTGVQKAAAASLCKRRCPASSKAEARGQGGRSGAATAVPRKRGGSAQGSRPSDVSLRPPPFAPPAGGSAAELHKAKPPPPVFWLAGSARRPQPSGATRKN